MGWKPGQNQALDLGEIPHKRRLTDEELERLRANAPDREDHEMRKQYEKHQENVLNDIINAGDDAVDSLTLISSIQDDDDFGIGDYVLIPDFKEQVQEKLNEYKSSLDIDTVMSVWIRKELKPDMFYFGINPDSSISSGFTVTLVPTITWDDEKRLDHRQFEDYILPEWLVRNDSRTFITDQKTPAEVRRELIKLGFVENHEVVNG